MQHTLYAAIIAGMILASAEPAESGRMPPEQYITRLAHGKPLTYQNVKPQLMNSTVNTCGCPNDQVAKALRAQNQRFIQQVFGHLPSGDTPMGL